MRKTIFANEEIYHVFNRGLEKRPVFTDKREFERALITLDFYRFAKTPLRLSKVMLLNREREEEFWMRLKENGGRRVGVICYCFMPNHFHFLLRQNEDGGISKFLSDFANSYTRYFNTKHDERLGPIFQGNFGAVRIEDNEQLLHVFRYICINPAVSFIVKKEELETYPWSALLEFSGNKNRGISEKEIILEQFSSIEKFKEFIFDQVDYGRTIKGIEHLLLE